MDNADEYKRLITISRRLFQIIGMGMYDLPWHWWRAAIFVLYQSASIVSNYIVADVLLQHGNLNAFSTCIVMLSATGLVFVKIAIVMYMHVEFNASFMWVQRCYAEHFHCGLIDDIWRRTHQKCTKDTLFFTRILYRMYLFCIFLIFFMNIILNGTNPPLEFYAVFLEPHRSYYYLGNFLYQLILCLMLLLCAASVESAFVMLTIFCGARLKFILELLDLLAKSNTERGGELTRLKLINKIIELHQDVLKGVAKVSDLFKTMLLIQFIGSLGSEIFSFYILQTHFYLSMLFAAASPVAQVFMYSFLGDQLGQQADLLPNKIYCTNWYEMSQTEKKHLLLMMHQAQQPVYLSIGGFSQLKLTAFTDLGRSAFSYCAVLNSISL